MSRSADLETFYQLLERLEKQSGGKSSFDHFSPGNKGIIAGLCFFFENGEMRENKTQMRVVRVASSFNTANKKGIGLINQLKIDRGTSAGSYRGGGNHRESIFRYFIGTSLIKKEGISCDSWGQDIKANRKIRKAEHSLEIKVSDIIKEINFICINADRQPGLESRIEYLEKNSIALLGNFNKKPIDNPSPQWLGNYCRNSLVRESGLWNSNYVMGHYDNAFLGELERIITG